MKQNQLTITETKYLRCLAKKHILLPTKHKKPLVKNWNVFYSEKKTIEQLLTLNQEYSLRAGKLIAGGYYFIAIDLDDLWAKDRINDVRYIETNKGIHRYILIKELPKSCWLVDEDGDRIGELHSWGRFVVGIGSIHEKGTRYTLKGRNNLKWSLKMENLGEFQTYLTERKIFTTPWGKTGKENIRNLQLFQPKTKLKKLSNQQSFYHKKKELEEKVNNNPKKEILNICYICLVYFEKKSKIIKSHLQGKNHQKNWKILQAKQNKPTTILKNNIIWQSNPK